MALFLLEKWVDCAMHYECICGLASPPGHCMLQQYEKGDIAYNGCHRYDQATLSILVAKYYSQYRNSITSRECSKSFLVMRQPTMDWRKYIAEDLHWHYSYLILVLLLQLSLPLVSVFLKKKKWQSNSQVHLHGELHLFTICDTWTERQIKADPM